MLLGLLIVAITTETIGLYNYTRHSKIRNCSECEKCPIAGVQIICIVEVSPFLVDSSSISIKEILVSNSILLFSVRCS